MNCPLVEKAESLVSQIEAQELPDIESMASSLFEPSDWGNWSYNQILAHIRHEYTNYEKLLDELPSCPADCNGLVDEQECIQRIIAHDTLKWAAKEAAAEAYQHLLDRQKESTPNLPATRKQVAITADVTSLLDDWLAHCKDADGASPKTLTAYRKGMQVFTDWLRDTGNAGTVTPATVVQFKSWLAERYSAQTVNLRLSAVRSFYRWCVVTERLPVSPAASVKGAKRPKSKIHKRDALTNGEVLAVLATCDKGTLAGVRDAAILSLMAYCGLREIEVHRANVGNLKTQGDRLVLEVQGKGRAEADEVVVIPPGQEAVIREWVAHRMTFADHSDGDPLFVSLSNRTRGQRLVTRSIRAMVKSRYQLAGVVGNRKTTHSLRHSAITNAIRHGATPMQVQAMARHSSFDTTLNYFHAEARTANPAEDFIVYENLSES